MENLAMIACIDQDGGLGLKGEVIVEYPGRFTVFKQTTMGHPILMGRQTFESIGRPLPGRENIVLSHSKGNDPNVKWCDETELAEYLQKTHEKVFVIGGASLYKKFLPAAAELYLTEVEAAKPADVFFPQFDRDNYAAEILQTGTVPDTTIKYQIKYYRRKV